MYTEIETLAQELIDLERREKKATERFRNIMLQIVQRKREVSRQIHKATLCVPDLEVANIVRQHMACLTGAKSERRAELAKSNWEKKTPEQREDWVRRIKEGRLKRKE